MSDFTHLKREPLGHPAWNLRTMESHWEWGTLCGLTQPTEAISREPTCQICVRVRQVNLEAPRYEGPGWLGWQT